MPNHKKARRTPSGKLAILELKELEKLFPDFEMCHVCLGKGVLWPKTSRAPRHNFARLRNLILRTLNLIRALAAFKNIRKTMTQLEEFRRAERLGVYSAHTHQDVGRVV